VKAKSDVRKDASALGHAFHGAAFAVDESCHRRLCQIPVEVCGGGFGSESVRVQRLQQLRQLIRS